MKGYGVFEKVAFNTRNPNNSDIWGDELLGLFERTYEIILKNEINVEEAVKKYRENAKKLGIDEYLNELNGVLEGS